jgi:hypothetical protein
MVGLVGNSTSRGLSIRGLTWEDLGRYRKGEPRNVRVLSKTGGSTPKFTDMPMFIGNTMDFPLGITVPALETTQPSRICSPVNIGAMLLVQ